MAKRIILLLLVFTSFLLHSQYLDIKGIVSDIQTNNPIPFATVYLSKSKIGCYTNEEGMFVISSLHMDDTLIISHMSYQTQKLNLSVNIAATLSIKLQPSSYELTTVEVVPEKKKVSRFDLGFYGKKPKATMDVFRAIGYQIAVLILNTTNNNGIIESINFETVRRWEKTKKYINHNMHIRLKLWTYDIYTKQPGESLLKEDVIVHIDNVKTRGYEINIASQGILFPLEGVFVGIEFLGNPDIAPSLQFLVGPGIAYADVSTENKCYYKVFEQNIWLDRYVNLGRSEVPKFGLTLIEIE